MAAIMSMCLVAPLCAHSVHIIKAGDTIYSLARDHNMSVAKLLAANNISNPTEVRIGTRINIPPRGAATTPQRETGAAATHHVQKGETYFSIAQKYNLTLSELLSRNNRNANDVLKVNEQLTINGASIDDAPAIRSSLPSAAAPLPAAVSQRARVASTAETGKWPHAGSRTTTNGKFPAVLISANEGDSGRAVTSGRIVHIDRTPTFGNVVFVQAETGHIYIYGGNDEIAVDIGDRITTGAFIGRVGERTIGTATSQVYFSVWHNNNFIDPYKAPRG